jgi:hydroxyacylglutathione hydrolase
VIGRTPSPDHPVGEPRGGPVPPEAAPARLEPRDLRERLRPGGVLVDCRDPRAFGAGHLEGSLNVWIDGPQFAERVSWFVPAGATLFLLAATGADVARAVAALAGAGRDVAGYITGAEAVTQAGLPVGTLPNVTPGELARRLAREPDLVVLDVREPAEWEEGHVPGARHIPMRQVAGRVAELPRDRPIAVTCAGGARSSLVASLLLGRGFTRLVNVWGGMAGWAQSGLPTARD